MPSRSVPLICNHRDSYSVTILIFNDLFHSHSFWRLLYPIDTSVLKFSTIVICYR